MVLSFDDIKIQVNLIYDKYSGEHIGYDNIKDPDFNYSFENVNNFDKYVQIYYVRDLASDFKFALTYFATKGITSSQIMPNIWEVVVILELNCQFPVIATVSIRVSCNRSSIECITFVMKIINQMLFAGL